MRGNPFHLLKRSHVAAFAPTIKIFFTVAVGFFITRQGWFPPPAARGVAWLSMVGLTWDDTEANHKNTGLPCLLFSSMVSSIDPSNIAGVGSLAIVAICYQALGAILALIVREITYVPPDFYYGIIVVSFWTFVLKA